MVLDYLILGAGLSGLCSAKIINAQNLGTVMVLEKSRGVGGRMATRRTLETRFDHGAQFYRLKKDIENLHQRWSQEGKSNAWFESREGKHWCAKDGMTALAKSLARDLEIGLEKLVNSITFENGHWRVVSDKNEVWIARNLILTSPLPQSIKLLEGAINTNSFDEEKFNELKEIHYTKALIALLTLEEDLKINEEGYAEFSTGEFFSISDQRRKGVSEIPALTVTMSPDFSEEIFEQKDELILDKILQTFLRHFPTAKLKESELKKWRYCKPLAQDNNLFCQIAPNLFLIGDAFGGSSLLGAVRSAEGLCQYLVSRQ